MIELYSWQLDALKKMHKGCILNGGTGSGKSLTSLAYYYILNGGKESTIKGGGYMKMRNPPKDLYIITTAQKRDNLEWEFECQRFMLSTMPEHNLYSNKVIIDSWNNIKKYKDVSDAFFIFDEQRVTGKGTWVKSFLNIARKNFWILLSATPGDTWSDYIPVFIANGWYKNKTEFARMHIVYNQYTTYPSIKSYLNEGVLLKHRNEILIDMDFDRPTTQHHIDVGVSYNISDYKDILKTRWNPYTDQPCNNASDLCYTLRKVVNSDPSRIETLLTILQEKDRVIIFYNYDYELEILRNVCKELAPWYEVAEYNGHKHDALPKGEHWVYLVNYAAGNAGWNCTSTDTIIFYSMNYSYKVMVQAAGRIDRVNTPYKELYYYHLKSRSGIDLAISKALRNKKEFNERGYANGLR